MNGFGFRMHSPSRSTGDAVSAKLTCATSDAFTDTIFGTDLWYGADSHKLKLSLRLQDHTGNLDVAPLHQHACVV